MNLMSYSRFSSTCSKAITKEYSTSFYSAIRLLQTDLRKPVYAIYGMVRIADEIVDTFHAFDKERLLEDFKTETYRAIETGISLNPVLQSFQQTVVRYQIDRSLIEAFFASMEKDLHKKDYCDPAELQEYIYGSAEAVGLMCLCVFCDGNKTLYESLKTYARALGAAFQKVNFLRDLQSDTNNLQRNYFPEFHAGNFTQSCKQKIEKDIEKDFQLGYQGVKLLPLSARFGVYVAYRYYLALFKKLQNSEAEKILNQRIRVSNYSKLLIVFKAGLRNQLNII